jgi:hypothetical protein
MVTEDEKKSFQTIIDDYYQDFLKAVVSGRNNKISLDELRPLADGRVYTARQALQYKLIDEIGYHCRDYFVAQWDRFRHYPGGVLAHSTHLKGIGISQENFF